MAFNPPTTSHGVPMRLDGEYLVLEREKIEAEVKIENASGTKKGEGKLYITTARMVFVSKNRDPSFSSFDIPFTHIYDEKFVQPTFGANYLSLRVKPLFGMMPGDFTVKLWFKSGGCTKFIQCFSILMSQIRESNRVDQSFVDDLVSGNLQNQSTAFVDPNDPSMVFIDQPEVQSSNADVRNYYAPLNQESKPKESFGTTEKTSEPNVWSIGTSDQSNKPKESKAWSIGTSNQSNTTSFPGQGVQIGGIQQSKPYESGMIPPVNYDSYPSNSYPSDSYPTTTTTIHAAESSEPKTLYPTFSQQPSVNYYYKN